MWVPSSGRDTAVAGVVEAGVPAEPAGHQAEADLPAAPAQEEAEQVPVLGGGAVAHGLAVAPRAGRRHPHRAAAAEEQALPEGRPQAPQGHLQTASLRPPVGVTDDMVEPAPLAGVALAHGGQLPGADAALRPLVEAEPVEGGFAAAEPQPQGPVRHGAGVGPRLGGGLVSLPRQGRTDVGGGGTRGEDEGAQQSAGGGAREHGRQRRKDHAGGGSGSPPSGRRLPGALGDGRVKPGSHSWDHRRDLPPGRSGH